MPHARKIACPKVLASTESLELRAAAEEALCRCFKNHAREALEAGAVYQVDLKIKGTINDEPYCNRCIGALNVDHDTQSSSSSGPGAGELLALVLAKLTRPKREQFLRDIVEQYAANGNQLPEVDKVLVALVEATLKSMRSYETVSKKGSVKFSPAVPAIAG